MDKTIRVTATLDDAAFDKTYRKLQMLTAEVKKFAEASKGIGNFGGGFASVGTKTPLAGTGGAKAGNQSVAVAGVDNVGKISQNLKSASRDTEKALKEMGSAFANYVGLSTREGDRFLQVIGRLKQGLTGLGNVMGTWNKGGKAGGMAMSAPGNPQLDAYKESMRINGLTPRTGETGSPFYNGGAAAGRFAGMGGALLAGAGGILTGAALGIAGTYAVGQQLRKNDLGQLAYNQTAPYIGSSRRAALGSMYGGSALAIRGGDFAEAVSQRRAARSSEMGRINSDWSVNETAITAMNNPGTEGGFFNAMRAGKGSQYLTDKLFTRTGDMPSLDRERQIAFEAMPQKLAEKAEEQARNQRMSDPVYMNRLNDIAGNATGSRAMSRSLGISGGVRNRLSSSSVWEQGEGYGGRSVTKITNSPVDTLLEMQSRATRSGYDLGDYAGIRAQIAAKAGRSSMYSNNEALLSAQAGGLSNAVDVYGMAGQLAGSRGAGGYFNKIQGMFGGPRGLDVTAAGGVLGTAQGMIQGGNFLGGGPNAGQGFIQNLMNASMGGGGAGDMYQSRIAQAGLGAISARDNGSIDPFQMAANRVSAIRTLGPNATSTALSTLQGLDTATRQDIMGGGKLAQVYKDAGISENDVKKDQRSRMGMTMARFFEGGGSGDSKIAQEVSKYRESGGLEYMRDYSAKDRKAAIERLGLGAKLSGAASSLEAGIGMFDVDAASMGIGPKSRGSGARRSDSSKSIYASANVATAEMQLDEAKARAAQEKSITNDNAVVAAESRLKEAQATQAKSAGDGSPEGALKAVSDALQNFVQALGSKFGGSGTGHARAPQPR